MAQNQYPSGAFRTPGYIRYANPNPNAAERINLFITDGIRIDNIVEAILTTSGDPVVPKPGYKYIIGNSSSVPSAISDNLETELSNEGLSNNDIVIFNDINGGQWELHFSANNPAFGASGGAFVYVAADKSFYGYDGDEWGPIAAGTEGVTGATGEVIAYGVKYNLIASSGTPTTGQVALSNSFGEGIRTFKIHKTSNNLGANFDLQDILFPNGTSGTNSKVSIFLYNKTIDRTYGFRFKPNTNGYSNPVYTIDDIADHDYLKVLIDESTAYQESSTWEGVNAWDAGDEIFVYAIADGVDGEQGETGDQGQGITLATNPPNTDQLYVQYLDSDGTPFGDPIPTGIVSGEDGPTGDPGEVGLYMYFTGGGSDWEDSSTSYTENTLVTATPAGSIRWGNNVDLVDLDDQDAIALSYITSEDSPTLTFSSLNLTTEEFASGEWYNRPGTLYFYTYENDYDIRMRSFLRYEKIKGKFSSGNGAVILAGLGVSFSSSSDGSLGLAPGEYGFVLPSPSGVKGTGITFGVVEDNTLYLDYIDADGNTFGRFATVQGISGSEGQMNPFNIRYGTTADGVGLQVGYISVERTGGESTIPNNLSVSGTAENGTYVYDYLNQAADIGIKSGYLTVFDRNDSSKFGIFRFKDMTATLNGVVFSIPQTDTSGHVAGPLTEIIGTAPTGLPLGDNTALFAISLDGRRGFTGQIVGYTFGIEYFSGPDRPQQRTDGTALEIGDKWYCTTVGLEFTFLGASGDEGSVVGAGVSQGSDTIWVQTNNARQGRRGPKGEAGIGFQGITGATGFNYRGLWDPNSVYNKRDVVFTTYSRLLQNNFGNSGNWNGFFNSIGMPNTTSASFIALKDFPSGHPGVTPINVLDWGVLIGGYSGIQGNTGATGSRGTGVISTSYNQVSDTLTFTHQNYIGESTSNTFTTNVSGVRGPIGPTGPIGGSNNQYLYRLDAQTSSSNGNLTIVTEYQHYYDIMRN
jgi:hypothetical protein